MSSNLSEVDNGVCLGMDFLGDIVADFSDDALFRDVLLTNGLAVLSLAIMLYS
jgi:hypothetical protein